MNNNEYFVAIILIAFLLFGLWDYLQGKIKVRRFYRNNNFSDNGKSSFSSLPDSELLGPLETSNIYTGQFKGRTLGHCKAHPKTRGQFTLSKIKRRHNQSIWAITILRCDENLPAFCMLPKTASETMLLMLNNTGIEFEDHEEFTQRYHVRSDNRERFKSLLTAEFLQFSLTRELISIESINNSVIIKRIWPAEHFDTKFSAELNCAIHIAETMS